MTTSDIARRAAEHIVIDTHVLSRTSHKVSVAAEIIDAAIAAATAELVEQATRNHREKMKADAAEIGRYAGKLSRVEARLSERDKLCAAIMEHRAQKADDRCWLDDDRLYEALGDGIKCDRRVGDKTAMLVNCARFIERRCEAGGPWVSYAELEREVAALREKVTLPERLIHANAELGEATVDALVRVKELERQRDELLAAAGAAVEMLYEESRRLERHNLSAGAAFALSVSDVLAAAIAAAGASTARGEETP